VRLLSKWLNIIEVSILWIVIISIYYLSIPIDIDKSNIYITSNSPTDVIKELSKDGYSVSEIDILILSLLNKNIKKGWLYLGKHKNDRLTILNYIAYKARYKKITLIPGETTEIFFNTLAKKLDLDREQLSLVYKRVCRYKEASILADSYNIPTNYNESNVLEFLCSKSDKKYETMSKSIFGKYDYGLWNRVLTVASIVQKEAANVSEMPKVSSVIHNRLKKKMRLQMDGTLNYGKYSHIKVTPKRIKEDNSTFNTYRHYGLPAYPICNVSIKAIKSALFPSQTPYLYFMKNIKGTHDFAKTYSEHLKNIKRKKEYLKHNH